MGTKGSCQMFLGETISLILTSTKIKDWGVQRLSIYKYDIDKITQNDKKTQSWIILIKIDGSKDEKTEMVNAADYLKHEASETLSLSH